jgi:hypothetical protein
MSSDDQHRLLSQRARDAMTGLRSAVTVAGSAPTGAPLDVAVDATVRQRLDEITAAISDVTAYARRL